MRIRGLKRSRSKANGQICIVAKNGVLKEKQDKVFLPEDNRAPGFLEKILSNPDLGLQIVVIILTMTSENMQMERKIEGVTSAVEKIRNIAEVLAHTMNSVKAASETPQKIRQMLK